MTDEQPAEAPAEAPVEEPKEPAAEEAPAEPAAPSLIDKATEAAERLEAANKKAEELRTKEILSGQATAGEAIPEAVKVDPKVQKLNDECDRIKSFVGR